MAYRQSHRGGSSFGYGLTPWTQRLLIANVVVWLAGLAVPALNVWFALVPADTLVRPWTLVTYMFVHGGFLHLFFNMIVLFFFGPPLEGLWGGREFLKFYLVAGLAGAVFSYVFAFNAAVVGASAAIYGLMLAFAMTWPDMPIHIWGILPIKAKWLVGFLAAVSILSLVGGQQDGVAHFAHLGGFVGAYAYLKLQDKLTMRLGGIQDMVRRRKLSVTPGGGEQVEKEPSRSRRAQEKEEQMLDSESGLQSLSEEEVALLDRASRKYRQN